MAALATMDDLELMVASITGEGSSQVDMADDSIMEDQLLEDLILKLNETISAKAESDLISLLNEYIQNKDKEIRRVSAMGYKTFIKSTQEIRQMRSAARQHKIDVENLNASLQSKGRSIIEKLHQRNQQEKLSEASKQAANIAAKAREAHSLVASAKAQLDRGHLYLALVAAKKANDVKLLLERSTPEPALARNIAKRIYSNNKHINALEKPFEYANRSSFSQGLNQRLADDIEGLFAEAKGHLLRGLSVWSEEVQATMLRFGQDLLHSALEGSVGRSMKAASTQDHGHVGEFSEETLKTSSSYKQTRPFASLGTEFDSSATVNTSAIATNYRLDLRRLKQFYFGYEVLDQLNVAQEAYQSIRLPVLRSACVDFADQGIPSLNLLRTKTELGISGKSRHELIRQIPLACARVASAFFTEDLVQCHVSKSLMPPALLTKQWVLSCNTICRMCHILALKIKSDTGQSGHDAAVLLRIDRSVLGLYHAMRELSFLQGPAGHSLCAPLLRVVSSSEHIEAFTYDCVCQMRMQLNSILRDSSSMLRCKASFVTEEEFDTLCTPFGLDDQGSLSRNEMPCSAPFSAILPHVCLSIDQAVQKHRMHGALVPGAHFMIMHSRSLLVVSEGYTIVCNQYERLLREAADTEENNMSAVKLGKMHATRTPQARESTSDTTNVRAVHEIPDRHIMFLCQIVVDASFLSIACRTVGDRLVRHSLKIQDREELEKVKYIERRFVGIATDAQVHLHDQMRLHIEEVLNKAFEGGALDWSTCFLDKSANDGIISFLETLKHWFNMTSMLQTSHMHLVYFVAFRHVSKILMREIEAAAHGGWSKFPDGRDDRKLQKEKRPNEHNKVVASVTMPAIFNFSLHVEKIEQFAQEFNVHNLKQTLAEPRELCNLLLSGNIDAFTNSEIREQHYPSVQVNILVSILRRIKYVPPSTVKTSLSEKQDLKRSDRSPDQTRNFFSSMFGKSKETSPEDELEKSRTEGSSYPTSLPPPMTRREAEALALRIEKHFA